MSDPTAYPQQQVTPVCPRHPDRVVRALPALRPPVCPECQRPAAVGVQCVDCVPRAGRRRSARRARCSAARSATAAAGVTYAIIGDLRRRSTCCRRSVPEPRPTGICVRARRSARREPWRFLTAAFAARRASPHILFNMWRCGWWGRSTSSALLGRARFVAVYLRQRRSAARWCYLLLAAGRTLRTLRSATPGRRRRRCLGRGLRPVRGAARAPPAARPVVRGHVRHHRRSTP